MRIAFLFPGQGAQSAGMGLALADRYPPARALLDVASQASGRDLVELLRSGGPELARTENAQPAMVAVSLGICSALMAAGVRPDDTAGLSLGELPAWAVASGMDFALAVQVAAGRGRLMQEASLHNPGSMLALTECDEATALAAVEMGSAVGRLTIAGHTAPAEWVLSGDVAAIERVHQRWGGVLLPVSGAWHSEAMRSAVEPYRALLRQAVGVQVCVPPPDIDFVSAGDPDPVEHLASKLVQPDRWVEVLELLGRKGVEAFVTVGPGRVIRSLARRTLGPEVHILSTEEPSDLDATLRELRA